MTRHFRWRGLVNKSRERTLCALEAFGPQTAPQLARCLGWSRPRDLRLRHLDRLEELGLVAPDDAGVYRLVGDYGAAQDEVLRTPYSVNDGPEASEEERRELDRDRYARQREAYFRQRVDEEPPPEIEPDGEIRDLELVDEPEPMPSEAEVFEIARGLQVIEGGCEKEPDHELADALADFLDRNPHRRRETPSWLGTALWSEELVEGKPNPEDVAGALVLLEMPA